MLWWGSLSRSSPCWSFCMVKLLISGRFCLDKGNAFHAAYAFCSGGAGGYECISSKLVCRLFLIFIFYLLLLYKHITETGQLLGLVWTTKHCNPETNTGLPSLSLFNKSKTKKEKIEVFHAFTVVQYFNNCIAECVWARLCCLVLGPLKPWCLLCKAGNRGVARKLWCNSSLRCVEEFLPKGKGSDHVCAMPCGLVRCQLCLIRRRGIFRSFL